MNKYIYYLTGIIFFICILFVLSACINKTTQLYAIAQNDMIGFINKSGKLIVEPKFEDTSFSKKTS